MYQAGSDGSPLDLSDSETFAVGLLNPLDQIVAALDGARAVDQFPDHVRLCNLAPPRPALQARSALLVKLDGDGRHGNTGILPLEEAES